MRDKFSELIKAGVASFQERPVGSPIPTLDPIIRCYNSCWGALTDTHMSRVEDGYIITGTFVKGPHWDRFKYASFWGSTNIKLGSGFCSLENMVSSYGYQMRPDTYNSDYVIKLTPRPAESSEVPGEGCDCCVAACPTCPAVISLGESKIPHPFKDFFTGEQEKAIREEWEKGNGDAMKVVENLNSNKSINKFNFRLTADNEYIVVDEQLKIKL